MLQQMPAIRSFLTRMFDPKAPLATAQNAALQPFALTESFYHLETRLRKYLRFLVSLRIPAVADAIVR